MFKAADIVKKNEALIAGIIIKIRKNLFFLNLQLPSRKSIYL